MHAVSRHHAVGSPNVLDLGHHALVALIRQIGRFGDQPIQSRTLESLKPLRGFVGILGQRGEMDWGLRPLERLDQQRSPFVHRAISEVIVAQGQQVKGDERRRGLFREHLHP